jgi:cbb3-type cytochrome oxidase maturation protein
MSILSLIEKLIMDYVYLLVSLSVMLLIGAVCGILWAVKSDQFEDLEGPAERIIMDDRELQRKIHDR